ncbi:hypothetical protein RB195_002843 [Necator americanus]|uniref:Uncharacterized protein n=1 Tax=Necator americanus TaxID=51031 RepID=A0ABR1DKY1_NECAM
MEAFNDEWTNLMTADPSEVATFHEFITKYGDYSDDMQNAIAILNKMDTDETLIYDELAKQQIVPPSPAYPVQQTQKDDDQMQNGHAYSMDPPWSRPLQLPTSTALPPIYPIPPTDHSSSLFSNNRRFPPQSDPIVHLPSIHLLRPSVIASSIHNCLHMTSPTLRSRQTLSPKRVPQPTILSINKQQLHKRVRT